MPPAPAGTDEVVMDHGRATGAQMTTPFAPEASLEQVSGVQEPPRIVYVSAGGPEGVAEAPMKRAGQQSSESGAREVPFAL